MRRALRRVVGVLLVAGVVGLARPALAQTSPLPAPGMQPEQVVAPPTVPPPTPILLPRGLNARDEDLRLPTILSAKAAETSKSDTFASDAASPPASSPGVADALTAPTPPTQWGRPVSWQSETAAKPASVAPTTPAVQPAILGSAGGYTQINLTRTTPSTPSPPIDATALRPAHQWPPAYAVRPPEAAKGRPGVIVFEDQPAPKLATHPPTTGLFRPIVPEDLKRQVQTVCGRQARDVLVEVQRDGRVLVKVKVANAIAEQKLPSKIMTIPEMASPNVRLETVNGP